MKTRPPAACAMDAAADRPGHAGEVEMRSRLPSQYIWDEHSLDAMVQAHVAAPLARFIERQSFFFIATANRAGHCDSSFRGRELDASGRALPAILVLDPQHLLFPEFPGNGLYNSLGNIAENPHIGLLFVDFENRRRARVNGKAELMAATPEIRSVWPLAHAAVRVTVEQAYGNCSARIPKLVPVETGSDGGGPDGD